MIVPRFDDFQRNASLLGSFGRRLSGVALIDVGKGDTLARRFPGPYGLPPPPWGPIYRE